MDDIIEFANENLEGELDHDLLSYSADTARVLSSNSSRDWETSGISHLLNSSTVTNTALINSEGEPAGNCFPSSSSSAHLPTNTDDVNAISRPSSSSSRASRRKRNVIDPLNKKPRIDYKTPLHAERLNTAIDAVITALRGDPGAFHKNITLIAKSHDIPYNTLRDNVLRARGIEPRAHRNSERKRQAEAVAAAAERGVEYKAPKSTLQLQTVRVSILIGDALSDSPHRFEGANLHTNGHPPVDAHSSSIIASVDYPKPPFSDEKNRKRKLEDTQDSIMSSDALDVNAVADDGDADATIFTKFLPLDIVRDDSDSDDSINDA